MDSVMSWIFVFESQFVFDIEILKNCHAALNRVSKAAPSERSDDSRMLGKPLGSLDL